jgi:hypothetical protein
MEDLGRPKSAEKANAKKLIYNRKSPNVLMKKKDIKAKSKFSSLQNDRQYKTFYQGGNKEVQKDRK